MGEKDSEAPFRFIRNFSVLSVTLLRGAWTSRTLSRYTHHGHLAVVDVRAR